MEIKIVFAIRRRPPPPLNGTNFQTFFTPLFLLQLNPTNMKRILHLAYVKNITFKASYNWFKIDILRLDRVRKSARRASGCIATNATTATGVSELFSL